MDDILALIGRAHQGDKSARDILTEKNMGLVHSIARRFQNRGAELEDLVQIGCIGLLKAIDKFDLSGITILRLQVLTRQSILKDIYRKTDM